MDKKKRKPRKKSKPVTSDNPAEQVVEETLLGIDDSTTRAGSPDSANHGTPQAVTSKSGSSDVSRTLIGGETPGNSDLSSNALPRTVKDEARALCSEAAAGVDGLDSSTNERGNEMEYGNCDAVAGAVDHEGEKRQIPNVQMSHALAWVVDKEQLSVQMDDLKEALTLEKETSEVLQDKLTCLQGQIAERFVLEAGMQAEIDRLTAENVSLEGLVGARAQVEQLTAENAELQRLVGKSGENEQLTEEIKRLTRENLELSNLVSTQTEQLTSNIYGLTAENEALQSTVDSSQADILRLTTENAKLQILVGPGGETERLTAALRQMEAENKELQNLASVQGETGCLRAENAELQKEVVNRKDEIRILEEECRQMTSKMMSLERGIQQLEQEASIKARTEEDLSSSTTVLSTKRWEGWTVKDPRAIAAAVAEELRLQKEAVAQTVEKLLGENDHLIRKVNEQAAVISDLTLSLQCKSLANGPRPTNFERENSEPRFATDFIPDAAYVNGGQNGHNLDEHSHHKKQIAAVGIEESPAIVESPIIDVVIENHPFIPPMQSPKRIAAVEQEIVPFESTPGPVEPLLNVQSEQKKPDPPPGSRIIKAPFRLISFVAGYISGQDLVRK